MLAQLSGGFGAGEEEKELEPQDGGDGNPIFEAKPEFDYFCHFCVRIEVHQNHGTYAMCTVCGVKGSN